MKLYIATLLKKRLRLDWSTDKYPGITRHRQRLTGAVLEVSFNKHSTTFELSDFVKTSKKQRSNIVDVQIKDILQYNFIGICIAHKKDPYYLNTSFLIRNVFGRVPFELTVNLFSPILDSITAFPEIKKLLRITHNKYYYLRKKPMPQSLIEFDYVTETTEDLVYEEYNPYINLI
jgi:ribosomal protein L19